MPNAKDEWPSVGPAYDLAIASYQVAYQRLDAVDGRIQTLQTYVASVTLGVPVIVTAIESNPALDSIWFILAMLAFVGVFLIGASTKEFGSMKGISPTILYDEWLRIEEPEFKRTLIYWAGMHFEYHTKLINFKGWAANAMTGLFLLEGLMLVVWAVREI